MSGWKGLFLLGSMFSDSLRVSEYLGIEMLQGRSGIEGGGAENTRSSIFFLTSVI